MWSVESPQYNDHAHQYSIDICVLSKPGVGFHMSHCGVSLIHSGFSVRTVSALPVRKGSERLRWRCEWETRFTISSASSVLRARSTSAWVTATCSSTQTLCASRTSLSGPNSTTATWLRRISCSVWYSITLPYPAGFKVNERSKSRRLSPVQAASCMWHSYGIILLQERWSLLLSAGD